ncbi:MFS transporter [Candidatus Woesearchaeota archaeon]|nr:MFS transporter [Candidatus Woesearchaeota archaeon]
MHKELKFFLGATSFFEFAMGMLGPIYAIYVQNIGGDILTVGTAWSIFMIVSGIGIYIMGQIEDRIKNDRKEIILGYVIMSLGLLGYIFVSNIYQLFVVQVVLGISVVISAPAKDSFYTKYLDKGKYDSEWAAWEGSWYMVTGLAALAGAYLVKVYNFRVLFVIMFALSIVGLILTTQLKDKK